MSQSKKLTDGFMLRQTGGSREQDRSSKEFVQLSSTLANTTGASRRQPVCGSMAKIPKVISELEKNIKTLKKLSRELSKQKPLKKSKKASSKNLVQGHRVPASSLGRPQPVQLSVQPEVDSIKQSYATTFGKQTNNLIELYNFYKACMQKSGKGAFSSFSQSNNSTSIVRMNNTSVEGKLQSRSIKSRNTPSILSHKQDSSLEQQSCNTHLSKDHLEKESTNIFLDNDQDHSSGLSRSIFCNQNSSQDRSLTINQLQRMNTMMSSKGAEERSSNSTYLSSKESKIMKDIQSTTANSSNHTTERDPKSNSTRANTKKQHHPAKKDQHCNLPLQIKILRIDTESDPNIEKQCFQKGQIKIFQLNLCEELAKPQKQQKCNPISHQQYKKIKISKILQNEALAPEPTTQNHAPKSQKPKIQDLPIKPPPIANTLNINTQTSGDQRWSRPPSGTPHVQTNKPKSLQKPELKKIDDESIKIYEKNMLINKRKQQLNSKLKKEEKKDSKLDIDLDIVAPSALDEAILIEPISPVNNKNPPQFKNEQQQISKDFIKDGLLTKHDLSLWENMNILQEMYSTGELQLNACKENIFVQALGIIKKKKGFKKSKFYVDDIPPPKKAQRQVQVIDLNDLSPQLNKYPPPRPAKKNKASQPKKDDSLEGISLCQVDEDSLRFQIQSIQCEL